jgi:hypothetical protein
VVSDEHRYVFCLLFDMLLTENDHLELSRNGGGKGAVSCFVLCDECLVTKSVELKIIMM